MSEKASSSSSDEDAFLLRYLPGKSPEVVFLRREIAKLNSHAGISLVSSVLVLGESGSGKGHVSRVLAGHRRYLKIGGTREDPGIEAGLGAFLTDFQSVLVPAIPESLMESEFFGSKAGAFTDAKKDRLGYLAQGYSDILLDEIGDASVAIQAKLLGVVEDRRFLPIGAGRDEQKDFTARLIAATNRDLEQLIRLGRFREDFYWRLIEHPIHVPALRDQPENIPALCERIIEDLHGSMAGADIPQAPELNPEDINWASSYKWPGNVRQLKHALRLWLLEGANTRLRDVVNLVDSLSRTSSDGNSALTDLIAASLDTCLENGTSAANTLGDFLKPFTRTVEQAVCGWYRDRQKDLDDATLLRLFPGMELTSLKAKLSQWKTRGASK